LTPGQRILDAVPLIPRSGALTGWAAAYVGEVDQLDGRDARTMKDLPIRIACGSDLGRRDTASVEYTRDPLDLRDTVERFGFRVATGPRAVFDECRLAKSVEEGIVVIDACAHARLVTLEEFSIYVGNHAGWKGVAQARVAAKLGDAATRSGWESRLRACVVLDARLPIPQVNVPVFNVSGSLLGIADLLIVEAGLVLEFDGQGHRRRDRHREDNVREELFENENLIVARADSLDLTRYRPQLIHRMSAAYQRGLARDRSLDSWTIAPPDWWNDVNVSGSDLTDEEKAELFGT
jgi:hypothetical protein